MSVKPAAAQWQRGTHNIQIQNVAGSAITIKTEVGRRKTPLHSAVVPVGRNVGSPARLMRARSGAIPYTIREPLLDDLERWATSDNEFATCVIGGRGGSGKTRLGVELSELARKRGWLTGLLSDRADDEALETLADALAPRLIVIDYAETRREQLQLLLPHLANSATKRSPVRVLMLVRRRADARANWADSLRNYDDALDSLLDDAEIYDLEAEPLAIPDRYRLFESSTTALAERAALSNRKFMPPDLATAAFSNPLLVVIGAYLAVHGSSLLPGTKSELLAELLQHERRYWRTTARDRGLDSDDELLARIVALATLTGAPSETDAAAALELLPDFAGSAAMVLRKYARWIRDLYPATGRDYWSPLEPDLLGEHLVAETLSGEPGVVEGALADAVPARATRSLDVMTRASADYPEFRAVVEGALSLRVAALAKKAVEEIGAQSDALSLGAGPTLAANLDRALKLIRPRLIDLPEIIDALPQRPNLMLSELALTLTEMRVTQLRARDGALRDRDLGVALNNFGNRLADVGRLNESVVVLEDAVSIRRELLDGRTTSLSDLAASLGNLGATLQQQQRFAEAKIHGVEALAIRRQLVGLDEHQFSKSLAGCLNNLAAVISSLDEHDEALSLAKEAVAIYRRMATDQPLENEPLLAMALANLGAQLSRNERGQDGIGLSLDGVALFRRLAARDPSAYTADLAGALTNLAVAYGRQSFTGDAVEVTLEAIALYRVLATELPAVYLTSLAANLRNLSISYVQDEQFEPAVQAAVESVELYAAATAGDPEQHDQTLAQGQLILATAMVAAGRAHDAAGPARAAAEVFERLEEQQPGVWTGSLSHCRDLLGSANSADQ